MIFMQIPFKYQEGSSPLVIKIRGGIHPYHELNILTERFNVIEETHRLPKWDNKKDYLIPEWAAEVVVELGKNKVKMKCEGKDVFLLECHKLQRTEHRKGDRCWNV